MTEDVKGLAADLNANGVKKGKNWRGYTVYIPQYKKKCYVGLPYVILVKGDEARISTDSEAMAYLAYENAGEVEP